MRIDEIILLIFIGFGALLLVIYFLLRDRIHTKEPSGKKRGKEEQKHQLIKNHFNIDEKEYLLKEDRGVVNQYTLYVDGKQYLVQFQRSNESISIKKLVHVPLNTKFK